MRFPVKRKSIVSTALAAASAAVLGACLASTPASASATAAFEKTTGTATTVPQYVVLNCSSTAVVRPAGWTPYCADYGIYLSGMHWDGWDSHMAAGYGTVSENDNYPNHAQGKVYTVPALVTLWGSTTVPNHPGERRYTTMTLVFPGQRPPVYRYASGKWTVSYPATQTIGF
jgi:hypothetical protein